MRRKIKDIIAEIENASTPMPVFIESRYPYTYAYDYMRTHAERFVSPKDRAGCSRWLQAYCQTTGEDLQETLELLADAYMRENGITPPWEDRATA